MLPRKLRYFIYGFLLGVALSLHAQPSFSAEKCPLFKTQVLNYLQSGYALVFISVTHKNFPISFMAAQDGRWVILGIDENGHSCAVASGHSLEFFLERSL